VLENSVLIIVSLRDDIGAKKWISKSNSNDLSVKGFAPVSISQLKRYNDLMHT